MFSPKFLQETNLGKECAICHVEFDNWVSINNFGTDQEKRIRKSFCQYCPFCEACKRKKHKNVYRTF